MLIFLTNIFNIFVKKSYFSDCMIYTRLYILYIN